MASYSNKSSGEGGKGGRLPIGDNKAYVPPAGASNSYEKVLNKLDAKNAKALGKNRYSSDKLENR